MMNYVLSYKEYVSEKVVFSPEEQKQQDWLRVIGGCFVVLGGVGGVLSSLQGYLITMWEEENWRMNNDPDYHNKQPKTTIGKFLKKHHLKFILGIVFAACGVAAWGIYKMFFDTPMGVPSDTSQSLWGESETVDLNESQNQDKTASEIESLLKKINSRDIIKRFENDTYVSVQLKAIANSSSKESALPIALKLQEHINAKLHPNEIEILKQIGNTLPTKT